MVENEQVTQKAKQSSFLTREPFLYIFQKGQKKRVHMSLAFQSHITYENKAKNERATQNRKKSTKKFIGKLDWL